MASDSQISSKRVKTVSSIDAGGLGLRSPMSIDLTGDDSSHMKEEDQVRQRINVVPVHC